MRAGLWYGVVAVWLSVGCGGAASWRAGLSREAITPAENIWMSGYASRDHAAEGKLTDLWAKCLALEDERGARFLLVTMDLVGMGRELSLAVRSAIGERHGIPFERVILSTSHTHSGPVVGENLRAMYFYDEAESERVTAYAGVLRGKLEALAGEALAGLAPAELEWGNGRTTFAVNRRRNVEREVETLRTEEGLRGPVDHDLPVLAVRGEAGELRALVCGYACHATVLSGYQWSGDWPGYAQLELERRHPGVQAMVWAGCGADQNPLPRRKVELAEGYGSMLAEAVDAVLGAGLKRARGPLQAGYREMALSFAGVPTREELERATESENRYEAGRARVLLERWDREGGLAGEYPYPVQTWRFEEGPALVVLGGEVVVDYAVRLKAVMGRSRVWVMSYANDVMAYIPSRRVLVEGGYEGGGAMVYYGQPAPWSAEVEERIVGEVLRQLGVSGGEAIEGENALYADHSDLEIYLDPAGRVQVVEDAEGWRRRRSRILEGMELAMGALPEMERRGPLDVRELGREQQDGYVQVSLTFASGDGDRVPAYLLVPEGLGRGEAPGMLCLHQTVGIGKGEPVGLGGKPNLRYARELARRGYVCVAPDYPSFGDYAYDFDSDAYVSGTMKGIVNHMRAVDLLCERPEVDEERLGVIGHSLGGHNAMFVGVFDTRLKVVVSSCGWTPFPDYYDGKIAGWTSDRYMPRLRDAYGLDPARVPFDFYEVVAALAPRAFFSNSPVGDGNFAVEGVRKAARRARRVYRLLGEEGKLVVEHPDCGHDFPAEIREKAYRFIAEQLGGRP